MSLADKLVEKVSGGVTNEEEDEDGDLDDLEDEDDLDEEDDIEDEEKVEKVKAPKTRPQRKLPSGMYTLQDEFTDNSLKCSSAEESKLTDMYKLPKGTIVTAARESDPATTKTMSATTTKPTTTKPATTI